jgi:hypothetical protein
VADEVFVSVGKSVECLLKNNFTAWSFFIESNQWLVIVM